MAIDTELKARIDESMQRGGSQAGGKTLKAAIDRLVWQELRGTSRPVQRDTLLGAVQAYIRAKMAQAKPASVKTTGYLTITRLSPTLGKLANGTIVRVYSAAPVKLGDVLHYKLLNGRYTVEGVVPGFVKLSRGHEDMPDDIFVRLGDYIVPVQDADKTAGQYNAVIGGVNTSIESVGAYDETTIAMVADGELLLFSGSTLTKSKMLTSYLQAAAGELRTVAKVVCYKRNVYIQIRKQRHFVPPAGYTDFSTMQYADHVWPTYTAYDLLILNDRLEEVELKSASYSTLQHQNTFTGYVDVQVNRATKAVAWLYVHPTPATATLTQPTYKYKDTDPTAGDAEVICESNDAYLQFRRRLWQAKQDDPNLNFDPYARREVQLIDGPSRSYTMGAHSYSIYSDGKLLYTSAASVMTTAFEVTVRGGEIGAALIIDPITGAYYVLRHFETWGVTADGATARSISYSRENTDDYISRFYLQPPNKLARACVGICGYRVYDASTGQQITEFGGEAAFTKSELAAEDWVPAFEYHRLTPASAKWCLSDAVEPIFDSTLVNSSFEDLLYTDTSMPGFFILSRGGEALRSTWTDDFYNVVPCFGTTAEVAANRITVIGPIDNAGKPIGPRRILFSGTNLIASDGAIPAVTSTTGLYSINLITGAIVPEHTVQAAFNTTPPELLNDMPEAWTMAVAYGPVKVYRRQQHDIYVYDTNPSAVYISESDRYVGLGRYYADRLVTTYQSWYTTQLRRFSVESGVLQESWQLALSRASNALNRRIYVGKIEQEGP